MQPDLFRGTGPIASGPVDDDIFDNGCEHHSDPLVRGRMRSDICEILRERIINAHYKPGESLSELKLAKELQVSRTPVREALIRLSAEENFVTLVPNVGARVSDVNLRDFRHIIEVRLIIERGIAKLAARNATEEDIADLESLMDNMNSIAQEDVMQLIDCDRKFHRILVRATKNPLMDKYSANVRDQFVRIQILLQIKPNRMRSDMPEVIAALKSRDACELEKLLVRHVENFVVKVNDLFHIGTYA